MLERVPPFPSFPSPVVLRLLVLVFLLLLSFLIPHTLRRRTFSISMASFLRFLFASLFISLVSATVPSNTTVGTFGPFVSYTPVDDWIYPVNQTIPINISLGNASLAL